MNDPHPSVGGLEGSEVARALAAMAAETCALHETVEGTIADTLARWLAARYVVTANHLVEEAGDKGLDLPTLAALSADVVALRKGDHAAERLRIERERLELERERDGHRMQARFEEWLKQPGMVDRICGPGLTPEEKEGRLRELFGLGTQLSPGLSPETIARMEEALRLL